MKSSLAQCCAATFLVSCLASYANCQMGCARQPNSALPSSLFTAPVAPQPRSITLRAHLGGDLNADPFLNLGERIRVVPDPKEPFRSRNPILVDLPKSTPYQNAHDTLYYLRGFAIGNLSAANIFKH